MIFECQGVEIYFSGSNHYTSAGIVVRTTKINFHTRYQVSGIICKRLPARHECRIGKITQFDSLFTPQILVAIMRKPVANNYSGLKTESLEFRAQYACMRVIRAMQHQSVQLFTDIE